MSPDPQDKATGDSVSFQCMTKSTPTNKNKKIKKKMTKHPSKAHLPIVPTFLHGFQNAVG